MYQNYERNIAWIFYRFIHKYNDYNINEVDIYVDGIDLWNSIWKYVNHFLIIHSVAKYNIIIIKNHLWQSCSKNKGT